MFTACLQTQRYLHMYYHTWFVISPKVKCSTSCSNTHSTTWTHKPRNKAWNVIIPHHQDRRGPANASKVTGTISLDDRKFIHSCPKETPSTQVTIFWHPRRYSVHFINYHSLIQKYITSHCAPYIGDIHKECWKMPPNLDVAPSHAHPLSEPLKDITKQFRKPHVPHYEGHEHASTTGELFKLMLQCTSPGSNDSNFVIHVHLPYCIINTAFGISYPILGQYSKLRKYFR